MLIQFVFTLITTMIHSVMMKIMCLVVFMMEVIAVKKILMTHGIIIVICVTALKELNGLLCHALVMEVVTILMDNVTL